MTQPRFSPHSPAKLIAPYTPREPDDVAVTMQALDATNDAGICTIIVTFCLPVPSSAYARYSVPATLPSPSVELPLLSRS